MTTPAPASLPARDVAVIVPAAGQGLRMGGTPKQFRALGGAPVLVQTLRRFDAHPAVALLVVAVPGAEVGAVEAMLDRMHLETEVRIVAGGASRQGSVARALAALPEEIAVVLVHDAVRPFVHPSLVETVIAEARSQGAAVPAVPVADTLRHADGATFGATVPRDGLYLVQTPQGFRRALLDAAYARAALEATDDAALVQALGHVVRLVPGDRANVKLTTPDDWALAEALWAAQ